MAKLIGILGFSGDGKTTATVVGPDGIFKPGENYDGLNPEEHIIINLDKKELPFPNKMWSVEKKNYIATTELDKIKKVMEIAAKDPKIKSLSLDTINSYLTYKEYNDRKRMTFDLIN